MIIKIIPEEGDKNITEVEHHNVQEFFMFGNKKDENGDFIDFHDWRGGYRNLMGSLAYFSEVIKDERAQSVNRPKQNSIVKEMKLHPPTKDIIVEEEKDNVINLQKHLNDVASQERISPEEAEEIANKMMDEDAASEATLED